MEHLARGAAVPLLIAIIVQNLSFGKGPLADKLDRCLCAGQSLPLTHGLILPSSIFKRSYNSLIVSVTAIFRIRLEGAWTAARVAKSTNSKIIRIDDTGSVQV